jgi:Fe2+ transport system protein FeoA
MVVRHLQGGSADCHRLRELGFNESAEVRLICSGGAIIAQVQGAKICLSQSMAQSIMVASV